MKTGDYLINFYNRYGVRLKDLKAESAASLEQTKADALERINETADDAAIHDHHTPTSFTIDSRIFNSLDKPR